MLIWKRPETKNKSEEILTLFGRGAALEERMSKELIYIGLWGHKERNSKSTVILSPILHSHTYIADMEFITEMHRYAMVTVDQ